MNSIQRYVIDSLFAQNLYYPGVARDSCKYE